MIIYNSDNVVVRKMLYDYYNGILFQVFLDIIKHMFLYNKLSFTLGLQIVFICYFNFLFIIKNYLLFINIELSQQILLKETLNQAP